MVFRSTPTLRPRLILSDRAKADIRGILRHTLRQWGPEQRDIYHDHIYRGIDELLMFPEIGTRSHEIEGDVRLREIGRHIVVYEFVDGTVQVFRVFHKRMNIAERFNQKR